MHTSMAIYMYLVTETMTIYIVSGKKRSGSRLPQKYMCYIYSFCRKTVKKHASYDWYNVALWALFETAYTCYYSI